MKITDVTSKIITLGDNDGGYLPIHQCVCGEKFGYWNFVINTDSNDPNECPKCGAKLYFTIKINVYQVEDENETFPD